MQYTGRVSRKEGQLRGGMVQNCQKKEEERKEEENMKRRIINGDKEKKTPCLEGVWVAEGSG